jgi:anti-sigma regulatory factor (Ser/Thr protein kinase)
MEALGVTLVVQRTADAVRAARHQIRVLVSPHVADKGVLDDVELMASEALTNAFLHGTGDITASITRASGLLHVEVRDGGPGSGPAVSSGRVNHGRGLGLIEALAAEWGLKLDLFATVLWFEVSL